MESLSSGTLAGAGSFRCQQCGFILSLAASDALSLCPTCGGRDFARASLFSAEHNPSADFPVPSEAVPDERALSDLRTHLEQPGEYLVYESDGELVAVALTREWTRIGRSLTADVRFDDPTVSRRHALVVRHADGVRVLDDRSLNGVFVNSERVEWRALADGDEILVGRHRVRFVSVASDATGGVSSAVRPDALAGARQA